MASKWVRSSQTIPGFDENEYTNNAMAVHRSWENMLAEWGLRPFLDFVYGQSFKFWNFLLFGIHGGG
jgi:hypothetical protein